ncbi:hypothetical protein RJ640_024584 [Escallonia rubra]|uniref:Pentatricopeptide repeat-containing protein n=1 Tax=Escallonia rubra TaxID=112253 RepID=A0AA88UDB5_9ASTE|nr:hypothetical protein RJ640_024584 [Escallonia rubra]
MEITSPCPKSAVHPINYPFNSRNISNTIATSKKPAFRIHLSSQKPNRKTLQLTRPLEKKNKTTTPTCTSSDILRLIDALGFPVPMDVYASLVKECTVSRDPDLAIELHTHIERSGIRPRLSLLNRILLMYVSCGCMEHARQVFDEMSIKDLHSWAAMIAGYAHNSGYEEAVELFVEMQYHYYHDIDDMLKFPMSWILVCILQACVHTENIALGSQIHGWLIKAGSSRDVFLSSSLINFYGKNGCLEGADFVFNQVSRRNTVIWTARIVNNCREERFGDVIDIYKEMGREGARKNSFTVSSVLKACRKIEDGGHCGRQVHADAIKLGLVSKNYVQSVLVGMYGRFGLVTDARRMFEINADGRNAACWSSMLAGYIRNGFSIEAIKILYEMNVAGLKPQESLLNEIAEELRCLSEPTAVRNSVSWATKV